MCCILLYVPSLTASIAGAFLRGANGRFSEWAVDSPILSLAYWLCNRKVSSPVHTFVRPTVPAFDAWPIRRWVFDWLVDSLANH